MKKNLKKVVSLGMALSMASVMLSAGTVAAEEGEKVKVTMSTVVTDETMLHAQESMIKGAIESEFPNVEFELQVYSDRQNLMVEVAGGAGPDILDLDGPTDVVEFAKSGKAVDMTPYAEKYGWKDMLYSWAYDVSCYQGKLYSLPGGLEGMGMYYNMDVMNEHGWTIPQNLEELETLMAEIKDAGLIPISFGNSNYQGQVDHLYSTILSTYSGPETVKKAINGEIKFDDPEMVKSIDLLKKWWDAGYIMDQSSQAVTTDDQVAFFADGRAVMSISGTWFGNNNLPAYPDTNWDFELMPTLDENVGQLFPLAIGESYAINGNSENADICAEILNYLYTDMDNLYACIQAGALQPFPVDSFDYKMLEAPNEKIEHMNQVMFETSEENKIGYCSWAFWPADARIYMNENFDAVLLGQLTPEEYMANTQQYIDAAIEEGSTPVLP